MNWISKILLDHRAMEVIDEQSDKTTHKHSPLDDLVLYCLDMLCPCDINFITNHLDSRWEAGSVEARLNSSQYWATVARLKKVPVFLLELIMERAGHWVSRSLVLVTARRVVALRCRQAACIHEFSIPQLKMPLCPATSHGLHTAQLCTFVAKNCKKEHLPVLSIQPSEMDQLLNEAKLNFRDFNLSENSKGDKPEVASKPDTRDSTPIIVDAMGEIHMKPHHQQTLRNIVKAIGKSRWEDATQLLLQHHDHIVDFDAEDVEIYRRMAAYYRRHLDTDPQLGELSSREVECAALLHRVWAESLQGEALWQHVARHLRWTNTALLCSVIFTKYHFQRPQRSPGASSADPRPRRPGRRDPGEQLRGARPPRPRALAHHPPQEHGGAGGDGQAAAGGAVPGGRHPDRGLPPPLQVQRTEVRHRLCWG